MQPIKKISGEVRLPGSKSLSNRALLLAALAEGTTVVENILVRPPSLLACGAHRSHTRCTSPPLLSAAFGPFTGTLTSPKAPATCRTLMTSATWWVPSRISASS